MDKVRVLVERGPHAKVPAEVLDYELPILSELHTGVTEVSRTPVSAAKEREFDAEQEFGRLEIKYRQPDAMAALRLVYPTLAAFKAAIARAPAKSRAAA
jgi:hypothetical protein